MSVNPQPAHVEKSPTKILVKGRRKGTPKHKLPKLPEKKQREADKMATFKKLEKDLLTKANNHKYLDTHDLSKDIEDLKLNQIAFSDELKNQAKDLKNQSDLLQASIRNCNCGEKK